MGMAGSSDITQDTMSHAFRKFPDFRGKSEGEWNKWLRTTLTNRIKHERRWAHEWKRDDSDTVFLDGPSGANVADREKSPSQVVAQDDESCRAVMYLSQLPGRQGEVFLLRELQGLSSDEIAGMLKMKPSAVRGLLWRGTKNLQKMITNDLPVSSRDAAKAYLAYLRLKDAGVNVDRATFVVQHPGCATELQAMFALVDRIRAMWTASSMATK